MGLWYLLPVCARMRTTASESRARERQKPIGLSEGVSVLGEPGVGMGR